MQATRLVLQSVIHLEQTLCIMATRPSVATADVGVVKHCESGNNMENDVQEDAPDIHEVGACGVADEQLAVRAEVVVATQHPRHPAQAAQAVRSVLADS